MTHCVVVVVEFVVVVVVVDYDYDVVDYVDDDADIDGV